MKDDQARQLFLDAVLDRVGDGGGRLVAVDEYDGPVNDPTSARRACEAMDGADLALPPAQRLTMALQNTKIGTQVAKLCLFPNSPPVVTLRILKPTEMKFNVLEAKIPADMEPDASVLAEAIAAVTRSADALREKEAAVVSIASLRDVPAVERAMRLKGQI